MRCFLVVILVVLTVNADSSCENICTFLYNNSDWESHTSIADTAFIQPVTAGSVTGIVTASFETFTIGNRKKFDFLRFIKGEVTDGELDESNQPIFFKIIRTQNGILEGKQDGNNYGQTNLGYKIADNIQISDMNSGSYDIFFGDPEGPENLKYKYGSASIWNSFQTNNVRLRDVQTIKSDGRCTVYKYISACTDPTPRLCDDEQHVSQNVNLGSSFTLSCSGSGAPFLDVTWTKDGNPTETEPTTSSSTDDPDHKIQSTIKIDSITVDHLGNWTCTILNKNFKQSVNKTYTLKYSFPATVFESPHNDYFHGSKTNITTLTWVVQSWPLEQVTMECGNISVSRDENTSSVPPQLTFTLALRMENVVKCTIKDRKNVLETREITRVGYNCVAGEKGVGKECKVCENGKTSEAGIGNCFSANSSCTEGSWGVDKECSSCPENQTSFNGTVKIQECFPDVSYCEEGQYGYEDNCTSCPTEKTSFSKAKKINECFPDVSYCEGGQYGYGTDCRPCPNGETSDPKSKKITDCYIPEITPAPAKKDSLLIPISSGAGGLLVVLASITIACFVVRRKRLKKSSAGHQIKSRLVINTELSVVLSNTGALDATPANSSEHVEYANASISKQVPQNKYTSKVTENKTSPKENVSVDVTYAVINKVKDQPNGEHKMVPNGTHQKKTVQDPPKTGIAGSSKNVMDVDDDDAYAKLGDVKRVYSFDKDEDCVYSEVERPGSSKKFMKSIKNESRDNGISGAQPGIDVDEDPLYANVEESNPKGNIPKQTGYGLKNDDSSFIRRPTVDEEEDTYACVELVVTSKLRSRKSAAPAPAEAVEYSSIVQFQRRKSSEEHHVESEYG